MNAQFLSPQHGSQCNPDTARYAVVLCPYEKTTSYLKGTVNGPAKILEASEQVEYFDSETATQAITHGIYTHPPLNYDKGSVDTWLDQTQGVFKGIFQQNRFPVMLGGEHTISIAPIRAAARHFKDISILHFDAHSDMRDAYHGDKYSHASIMRRAHEAVRHSYSVGIRAQCQEERQYLLENPQFGVLYDHERASEGLDLGRALSYLPTKQIYITIDLDYFSPELMPSVGTPVPGGGHWYETLSFLRKIFSHRTVIGADVVELRPDHNTHCDLFAAQLVYKLITYASLCERPERTC